MIEISVVLPQPDGPTKSVIWPGCTSRSTPRSARTLVSPSPKSLVTPRQITARSTAAALPIVRSPFNGPPSHRDPERRKHREKVKRIFDMLSLVFCFRSFDLFGFFFAFFSAFSVTRWLALLIEKQRPAPKPVPCKCSPDLTARR